jgi:anti-anti-sigma factor
MATIEQAFESGTWIDSGPLSIRIERDPEELFVVEFYGELDLAGTELAQRELQIATESDAGEIIIDLSGLHFIDSCGLRVLCQADAAVRANGSPRLRFLRGQGQVDRVLRLTGLDEVLPFAD